MCDIHGLCGVYSLTRSKQVVVQRLHGNEETHTMVLIRAGKSENCQTELSQTELFMELLTMYISLSILPLGFVIWLTVTIIDTFDGGQAAMSLSLCLQAMVNAAAISSWASWGYFVLLYQLLFLCKVSSDLNNLLVESRHSHSLKKFSSGDYYFE